MTRGNVGLASQFWWWSFWAIKFTHWCADLSHTLPFLLDYWCYVQSFSTIEFCTIKLIWRITEIVHPSPNLIVIWGLNSNIKGDGLFDRWIKHEHFRWQMEQFALHDSMKLIFDSFFHTIDYRSYLSLFCKHGKT